MEPRRTDVASPGADSPASPFDAPSSPFREQLSSPHSPASLHGSNAPQTQSPMHVNPASAASAPRSAAAASSVKAPWDDDDDWGAPSAPTRMPAPAAAPAAPPSPSASRAAAAVPATAPSHPGSPAEPHTTPVVAAAAQPVADAFIAASPTASSPNRPPTPPEKPSAVNTAKLDALNKQIASRTAAADAATKEKEAKITAAAQEYLKTLKAKRENEVTAAKASHKQEQQAGTKKIDDFKKSGAVWSAVGMLVDLQKPNQFSKNTEQMRSVLSTLNAAPAKK
ncbi:Clathrin light chain [Novymonas esmeraldas]|uniref:Clathrin light chain n=1 Tax=Novymonas esmeraldas TaxID=1808958 RepID=A0AAW0EYT4_9TRYP